MPQDWDWEEGWTSGAKRSFLRATQLASTDQSTSVEPIHLLVALILDEGRAGSRLEAAGVTLERVWGSAQVSLQDLEGFAHQDSFIPWGPAMSQLLAESRHLAFHQSGTEEAGTEHLLASLLTAESPVRDLLARHGISAPVSPEAAPQPVSLITDTTPGDLDLAIDFEPAPELPRAEIFRILDAAANRVREGLRVVEDAARFGLNDRHLSSRLKQLRHDLSEALGILPHADLLASRDTIGDVGTSIETLDEYRRASISQVVTASFKRMEEALRTLEEFGKLLSIDMARQLERIRYQTYTLEKAMQLTEHSRQRLAAHSVYLLVTEAYCPTGAGRVIHEALEAGVRIFQVREKQLSDRALVSHCREVRKWTRAAGALLIINDRPDIALLVDADGVHVGQDELTVADARRVVGPNKLVGVSTHSIEQARQAVLDGADYLGVGPTFPSRTKTFDVYPGLDLVREVAAEITLPWFPIGGIDPDNIDDVVVAGASRVAVGQGITRSPNIADAVKTMEFALSIRLPASNHPE